MCKQVQTRNKQVQTALIIVTVAGVGMPVGEATDAVTGASVRFEKSDGAIPYTGGVVGTGFTSLSISFVFSDTEIAAATGALADEVTGALVGFGMTSDGVFFSEASK
jgi:hypothetical protein